MKKLPNEINGMPSHMLLNPLTRPELDRLLADDDWLLQPKWDGRRVRVSKRGDRITGLSRKHLLITLPKWPVKAAAALPDCDLDVELVGDELVVLDILSWNGNQLWVLPLMARVARLQNVTWPKGWIPTVSAFGAEDKLRLAASILAQGMEGYVLKLVSAPYSAGRPKKDGDGRKFKFQDSASVIVTGRTKDRRSVEVGLYDGTDLGNVTISANQGIPPTRSVIEIRDLYRSEKNGHLVQAVYMGVRDDIEASECTAEQLHVKGARR